MGKTLVTVVTICLNAEKYINKTICSVLNQNYQEIEYIVVDGVSSDNTLNIIKKYGKNIKWISEFDNGISDAMNKGLKNSMGDLIIYLNAGDVFNDNDVIANIVKSYENNKWDWAIGSTKLVDGDYKEIGIHKISNYNENNLRIVNFICHQSSVVRTELLKELGGFSNKYKIAMDYDLWFKLDKYSDAFILHFLISKYLIGGVSNNPSKAYKEFKVVRKENLKRNFLEYCYEETKAFMWFLLSDFKITIYTIKFIPKRIKYILRAIKNRLIIPKTYK